MPVRAKKGSPPVAATPPPPPPPAAVQAPPPAPDLPVLYDRIGIVEYSTTSKQGPLTIEDVVGLLGWETEKQFQARKVAEEVAKGNPNSKPEHWLFGDLYHCKDVSGQKVRCNYNAHNRPFDAGWSEDLQHTVLAGQWAGPHTIPGETVNGETIRISRYGRVLSGQHSMTGCKLADEKLQRDRELLGRKVADAKYPAWAGQEHCFLETIVITGMSEDARVLMTVDYVKQRSAADVFYTSDVFKSATPTDREDLCRTLASAVDLLWERTDARGYKTHPEVVAFLERHRRLLDCVLHIAAENSVSGGRKLSKLRLSPGHCAALCYLMGCAGPKTNGDVYRNEMPPTERGLDWSYWDRAQDFWVCLAADRGFMPVRMALGRLLDSEAQGPKAVDNLGMGGRLAEKLAIVAKAWDAYRDLPPSAGAPFRESDLAPDGILSLSYSDLDDQGKKLPDGRIKLLDIADFGGIDCPEVAPRTKGAGRTAPPAPPPPSREEIERATAEAHARRTAPR